MLKITLPGKPKPKPAGCIKYRNGRAYLSMDVRGYKKWQAKHKKALISKNIPIQDRPFGIVYQVIVPNRKGLGDLTNITNAVQDVLVQASVIPDDNSTHIRNVFECLTVDPDSGYFTNIWICRTKTEFIRIINSLLLVMDALYD